MADIIDLTTGAGTGDGSDIVDLNTNSTNSSNVTNDAAVSDPNDNNTTTTTTTTGAGKATKSSKVTKDCGVSDDAEASDVEITTNSSPVTKYAGIGDDSDNTKVNQTTNSSTITKDAGTRDSSNIKDVGKTSNSSQVIEDPGVSDTSETSKIDKPTDPSNTFTKSQKRKVSAEAEDDVIVQGHSLKKQRVTRSPTPSTKTAASFGRGKTVPKGYGAPAVPAPRAPVSSREVKHLLEGRDRGEILSNKRRRYNSPTPAPPARLAPPTPTPPTTPKTKSTSRRSRPQSKKQSSGEKKRAARRLKKTLLTPIKEVDEDEDEDEYDDGGDEDFIEMGDVQKVQEEKAEDEDWVIDCNCGVTYDDHRHLICCDGCDVWMHSSCNQVDPAEAEKEVFVFMCVKCKPPTKSTKLDKKRKRENPDGRARPGVASEQSKKRKTNRSVADEPARSPSPIRSPTPEHRSEHKQTGGKTLPGQNTFAAFLPPSLPAVERAESLHEFTGEEHQPDEQQQLDEQQQRGQQLDEHPNEQLDEQPDEQPDEQRNEAAAGSTTRPICPIGKQYDLVAMGIICFHTCELRCQWLATRTTDDPVEAPPSIERFDQIARQRGFENAFVAATIYARASVNQYHEMMSEGVENAEDLIRYTGVAGFDFAGVAELPSLDHVDHVDHADHAGQTTAEEGYTTATESHKVAEEEEVLIRTPSESFFFDNAFDDFEAVEEDGHTAPFLFEEFCKDSDEIEEHQITQPSLPTNTLDHSEEIEERQVTQPSLPTNTLDHSGDIEESVIREPSEKSKGKRRCDPNIPGNLDYSANIPEYGVHGNDGIQPQETETINPPQYLDTRQAQLVQEWYPERSTPTSDIPECREEPWLFCSEDDWLGRMETLGNQSTPWHSGQLKTCERQDRHSRWEKVPGGEKGEQEFKYRPCYVCTGCIDLACNTIPYSHPEVMRKTWLRLCGDCGHREIHAPELNGVMPAGYNTCTCQFKFSTQRIVCFECRVFELEEIQNKKTWEVEERKTFIGRNDVNEKRRQWIETEEGALEILKRELANQQPLRNGLGLTGSMVGSAPSRREKEDRACLAAGVKQKERELAAYKMAPPSVSIGDACRCGKPVDPHLSKVWVCAGCNGIKGGH